MVILVLLFILIACNAVSAADGSNNATQSNNSDNSTSALNTADSSLNVVISGNVTRCNNGSSFSGVTVTVSENGTEIANTTTDENGSYSLSFLSNSTVFNVTASYPGHTSSSSEVTVTSGQDNTSYATANFKLGMDKVYVSTTGKDSNDGSYDHPFATIAHAIDEVNSGGTINLLGYDVTYYYHSNGQIITKSLTITSISNDVTIDGENNRIFEISNEYDTGSITVTLYGLTLTNGDGAIYVSSNARYPQVTLIVQYCVFKNNINDHNTGTIYMSSNTQATFYYTTFKNNSGNSIYAGSRSSTTVDYCKFNSNSNTAISNAGTLTVTNSQFNGNTDSSISNSGTLNIANCTFTNNQALAGAGIYNTGTLTVNNSTFNSNTATTTSTYGDGAAIDNEGTCTITGSTFINNSAQSGTIYNGYNGVLKITGSTFTGNTATAGGGAIETYGTSCTVNNCTFIGNSAGSGGAICIRTNATINCSTFINNTVTTGGHGGAIYDSGSSSSTVHFCRILNNGGTDVYSDNANVVDATNNWWGNNFDGTNPIAAGRAYNVDADPWVVLTVTADPETIKYLETSTITVDLNHTNTGDLLVGGTIPDGYVTVTMPWGSFNSSTTTHTINGKTTNGVLKATFYANDSLTSLTNPVEVTANEDNYTTGDAYSAFITVQKAVLTLTETGSTMVYAGNSVNYTITITNTGPEAAEGVVLTDNMTGISAFNSGTLQYRWKLNNGAWSDWTTYEFTSPLVLNLGTLQNGDIITIEINGTVNASATNGNTIVNNVTATTTTTSGDKTAGVTTTIDTLTDLVVTLTGPATTTAGTQLTYTITVTNNGPSDAQNVQLIDVIPSILGNVTHDPFDLGTIAAGASKTIIINGTVPSNTANGTIIQNTATVTSDTSGTITPSETVHTTVDTLADVDITKVVDNAQPDVGDTVIFTVTAHNYGPSDATNIQIEDIMPADFTGVVITSSKGTYDNTTGIWTLNLTSGEEAYLNLTGNVTAVMAGMTTTNTANKTSQTETDQDTNDSASADVYVPKSDIYLKVTSSKKNPLMGEKFTLTYLLGNKGPDPAENVTVYVVVPDGFEIADIDGDGTWEYNENNRTIIWNFTTLNVTDPYLYLTGWFTAAGEYQFTASITSKTYNTNNLGITPITINAATPKTQVTSATTTGNTIGMQNTGTPINYLILAFLLVISGFVFNRKK